MTASPLLQRWFSATGHVAARDPYFLYAAGNCGSLLALIAYPLLERTGGFRSAGVATGTSWVVLTRSQGRLRPLVARGWHPLADPGPGRVWTDDYSSVLSVVKWGL